MNESTEFLNQFEAGVLPLLRSVSSVVIAVIDEQGELIDSNEGLNYIASKDHNLSLSENKLNVSHLFINPSFNELFATNPTEETTIVYRGIINLGEVNKAASSIKGVVFRDKKRLIVIGGYDIGELEQLNTIVTQLNDELAITQRELVTANRKLKQNEKKITELMLTDPLTGIANRRHFDDFFSREYERNKRHNPRNQPFCLVSGDIDNFKVVNDSWGHDVGDLILCSFAHTLKEHKRLNDFVARVGGEEFMIILPETSLDNGYIVINRIRELFKSQIFSGVDKPITASFGIAQYSEGDTPEQVIKKADIALYEAKNTGRDKVVCYKSK